MAWGIDCVVPVPMHWRAARLRGAHAADTLAACHRGRTGRAPACRPFDGVRRPGCRMNSRSRSAGRMSARPSSCGGRWGAAGAPDRRCLHDGVDSRRLPAARSAAEGQAAVYAAVIALAKPGQDRPPAPRCHRCLTPIHARHTRQRHPRCGSARGASASGPCANRMGGPPGAGPRPWRWISTSSRRRGMSVATWRSRRSAATACSSESWSGGAPGRSHRHRRAQYEGSAHGRDARARHRERAGAGHAVRCARRPHGGHARWRCRQAPWSARRAFGGSCK